jgi:starch synthase
MFLMPSRYEPCGLTQMYSMRYGTVPIVRSTGGLADTVEPCQEASGTGTGFRFDTPDGTGLMWAIDEALRVYGRPQAWKRLMRNGMARDFSWDRSAAQYVELFQRARARV